MGVDQMDVITEESERSPRDENSSDDSPPSVTTTSAEPTSFLKLEEASGSDQKQADAPLTELQDSEARSNFEDTSQTSIYESVPQRSTITVHDDPPSSKSQATESAFINVIISPEPLNQVPEKPKSDLFIKKGRALDFKSWQHWLDSVEGIDSVAEAKVRHH